MPAVKKLLALGFLGWSLCGSGCLDESRKMGPDEVFYKAYDLALDGKTWETAKFFTEEALKDNSGDPKAALAKAWALRLNNGSVKGLVTIEKQKEDKTFDIKFMMVMADGPMTEGEDRLVLVNGTWKFDSIQRVR